MVFRGDYEIEFEIYEKIEGDWRLKLLGHMPGLTAQDAKIRWVESHSIANDAREKIYALFPHTEWK
jgi:hypothetical protein